MYPVFYVKSAPRGKLTRWLLAAATALSLMLILAFAGCGGDDDAESTAEKEPSIYDDPKYAD
jgi:hypothetical protein